MNRVEAIEAAVRGEEILHEDFRGFVTYHDELFVYNTVSGGKMNVVNFFDAPSGYSIRKKEPKIEILYECLDNLGNTDFRFDDGSYPVFSEKKKVKDHNSKHLKRKTGITVKLNMETWETVK